jgi:DNA mismatch endonuclease (patch repair protein)
MELRRELHRRGLRYRVQYPILDRRRKHDIVFTRARIVVEVRGCFWHSCPQHATSPKANSDWWRQKLDTNTRRDRATAESLEAAGWRLEVVWEHETTSEAADRIERLVRGTGLSNR